MSGLDNHFSFCVTLEPFGELVDESYASQFFEMMEMYHHCSLFDSYEVTFLPYSFMAHLLDSNSIRFDQVAHYQQTRFFQFQL